MILEEKKLDIKPKNMADKQFIVWLPCKFLSSSYFFGLVFFITLISFGSGFGRKPLGPHSPLSIPKAERYTNKSNSWCQNKHRDTILCKNMTLNINIRGRNCTFIFPYILCKFMYFSEYVYFLPQGRKNFFDIILLCSKLMNK